MTPSYQSHERARQHLLSDSSDGGFVRTKRQPKEPATFMDFAQIDEDLGFSEPDAHPVIGERDQERIEAAALMLGDILTFIVSTPSRDAVAGRAIGMALCLRPGLFDQRTADSVAQQFGYSKAAFQKYLTSIRQRFGLKTIYAKCDGASEVYAANRTGKTTHTGDGLLHSLDSKYRAETDAEERSRMPQDDLSHAE